MTDQELTPKHRDIGNIPALMAALLAALRVPAECFDAVAGTGDDA